MNESPQSLVSALRGVQGSNDVNLFKAQEGSMPSIPDWATEPIEADD